MLQRALIRLNNRVTRWRRVKAPPGRVLLLLAHCLQSSACGRNLTREGGDGCARCGKCPVDALLGVRDRTGVLFHVVGGGRQALVRVRDDDVDAVVAVACERELIQGIFGAFPKPVLAIGNTRAQGDCHDTLTDVAEVEAAVRELIISEADGRETSRWGVDRSSRSCSGRPGDRPEAWHP
jgi:hypothetical protein